jgi:ubiquinone/menaquinone biosynthesis C-methylase UbiE
MPNFNLKIEIYEYLAQQIIQDYGITQGRCLDIGAGAGPMGLEIGKRTTLQVYLLDVDAERLNIAMENSCEYNLFHRTHFIKAPVEALPFIDGYFDLVVSRGSIFFWEDMAKGLSEAWRVLKGGGVAYIGGGTSRLMPREQAEEFTRWARPRHRESRPDWDQRTSPEYLHETLKKAGIKGYNLIRKNGTWIEMKK